MVGRSGRLQLPDIALAVGAVGSEVGLQHATCLCLGIRLFAAVRLCRHCQVCFLTDSPGAM
jgi:hypothetical protein